MSMENKKLWNFLREVPKVDLHRHLVGSIRLDTLIDIAIENGIPLPAHNKGELKSLVKPMRSNTLS